MVRIPGTTKLLPILTPSPKTYFEVKVFFQNVFPIKYLNVCVCTYSKLVSFLGIQKMFADL